MKRRVNFLSRANVIFGLSLILFGCFSAARGAVIPRACVESDTATFTTTLSQNRPIGATEIYTSSYPVSSGRIVINPGAANEETIFSSSVWSSSFYFLLRADGSSDPLKKAHSAGEPVQIISDAIVRFGYQNTDSNAVNIAYGSSNLMRLGQWVGLGSSGDRIDEADGLPTQFLPGIHENVFAGRFATGTRAYWSINGNTIIIPNSPQYRCATMTYQGRLTDGAAAANGQYDLRFQAFGAETGGAMQSSTMVENVTVTNGVFTAQLNLGGVLSNPQNFKFLEIAVRPSAASGNAPFTVLAPRQAITSAPFAVNAQTAESLNGKTASEFLQISNQYSTVQTGGFNLSGSGKIGGDLTTVGDASIGENLTVAGSATINSNLTVNGNAIVSGTLTSGCRTGFTAFAFGRLCVSAIQTAATYFGSTGAQQTCANLNARVGTTTDAAQANGTGNFNYFNNLPQGWLGDYAGDNKRAVWNIPVPSPDFDGDALNVYNGGSNGTAPVLPYRCVY